MKEKRKLLERGEHIWSEDSVRLILTPGSTAKNIYFYAQEVGYFKTEYPYFSERQNLESFLIVYTVSGQGHLKYGGEHYTLTKGTCFYIDCTQYHLYRAEKNEDWEILWIHFNGSSARGYYREFVRNGFGIVQLEDNSLIENTIWQIISLNRNKNLTTEAVTSNMISGILTELIVKTATKSTDNFMPPDYIRDIVREIERNYREELPLEYFENHYHRSKYHILREFKKHIGVTLNEYIILTRISHAKELLKYSDMPVSEITFEIGMKNVTHFINLFKAREDMTPLAYRKAWKEY